jgi:hypothetical protein
VNLISEDFHDFFSDIARIRRQFDKHNTLIFAAVLSELVILSSQKLYQTLPVFLIVTGIWFDLSSCQTNEDLSPCLDLHLIFHKSFQLSSFSVIFFLQFQFSLRSIAQILSSIFDQTGFDVLAELHF